MRTTTLAAFIALALLGTSLGACEGGDDQAPPEGIEVEPPEILDFGTIFECTEHSGAVTITNHGPDDQHVVIDYDSLIVEGFVLSSIQPELDLEAGDVYEIAIRVAPGEGGAGEREARLFIYADRAITIMVMADIVPGDEC